jgi:1-acyl-sn-glycerol-3-phosphate acyltransferase
LYLEADLDKMAFLSGADMSSSDTGWRSNPVLKSMIHTMVGALSYPGLALFNTMKVSGTDHLLGLPARNVLFVSNHVTYFTEVIAFLHVFCAVKWGKIDRLGCPYYLLSPFIGCSFVASEETMKKGALARFLSLAGAVEVKRTWRTGDRELKRDRDPGDTEKIVRALEKGWVITFPQGTTRAQAPGRKGTAHIIRRSRPIVVPIVARGFDRAFDKRGIRLRKIGTGLSVTFKSPLTFAPDASPEAILESVMDAIEENETYWGRPGPE